MPNNPLNKRRIRIVFIAILLFTTFIPSLLSNVTATPMVVDSVSPGSGQVGDIVRVTGQIDTANGSYIIFFNDERVGNGTAVEMMVNDTFNVRSHPKGSYSITLHDTNTLSNATAGFTIETAYSINAIVPTPPEQLQEGEVIEIQTIVTGGIENTRYSANITVTNPLGEVHYKDAFQLSNTTDTGYGEGSLTYPTDFGPNAHTNYIGFYVIAFNESLAIGSFTIGLTDRMEYRRSFEDDVKHVHIRGSGYKTDEIVTIDIMTTGESVAGYPRNISAVDGVMLDKWKIPENVTGIYTVTLKNITSSGTNKPVPDAQNFTVVDIILHCQAQNRYDKNPLAGLSVGVYIGTGVTTSGKTNKTGWIDFRLDRGNYTFKAFWNGKLVGSLAEGVTGDAADYVLQREFYIECELAHIEIAVYDEAGYSLPFINVNVTSDTLETTLLETNHTGMTDTNAFTNASYTIESRRYGYPFDTTLIENLTYTRNGKNRINITCPTYSLFVYALDSNEHALKDVEITVYEWSSERVVGSGFTDSNFGSVAFNCAFGKYRIKVESTEWGRKVVLNETVADLIENPLFFVVHCRISNLTPSVTVVDYLGQPLPNTEVRFEREFGQEYVNVVNSTTNSDGAVLLPNVGGDCRISIHVMGEFCEVRQLYLSESRTIEFKIDKYVAVGQYPLQVAQLITYALLTPLIVVFALALAYRRLLKSVKK